MIRTIDSVIALVCLLVSFACSQRNDASEAKDYQTWGHYRSTKTAAQFSGLDQINKENVHLLQPAWTYHTGDSKERTPMECNPMILGNVMYVSSPQLDLIALDAEKGTELWRFDPEEYGQSGGVNRGFFHYREGDKIRIFMAVGYYLFAIDAQSGELLTEFAEEGKLDLRKNLGVDPEALSISLSTPGVVFEDLIIIGSATGEGYDASPGHIRAYNAKTGAFEWIFHTIPKEGELGHDTWNWQEEENYGGANNWGGLSLDEEQGWVYVSTGSPAYDFYGGNRLGENLFGNSILALDAKTGERKWHYQAVTHDIWDYDLPCAATLVDIPSTNGVVKALVQPTKMGELILLDRLTGKPLMEMKERNVPPSYVPGEVAHPTQKFNQGITVTRQGLDSTMLTNISKEANAYVKEAYKKYRNEGLYTPPSLEGTLTFPATRGGMIWGGASYDPNNHMLYVNANEIPMILQVRNIAEKDGQGGKQSNFPGKNTYLSNCSNCHGADQEGLGEAFPSLKGLKERHDRASLTKIITHGNGLMPAFQGFEEKKLNALIDYLLEITPVSDPVHEI
ncbi:c-type cytochrome, partial [uncultured Cyclobacterium sp.]|uniref:c-type cytochrome n=1 Tax=uncultured Cyclobacterium sp. TaxID=453820 RepID=UPI0030EF6825